VCVMMMTTFSQALRDDVALHNVDIDDICRMARMLAAVSSIEMVTAEATQLAERFQALISNVEVTVVSTMLSSHIEVVEYIVVM